MRLSGACWKKLKVSRFVDYTTRHFSLIFIKEKGENRKDPAVILSWDHFASTDWPNPSLIYSFTVEPHIEVSIEPDRPGLIGILSIGGG